ncbi:hypothetical protein O6474_23165, partial [Salmonella enterica subsp. enterica]
VAQQLVMGDTRANLPLELLRTAYLAGFNTLLQWLAGLTLFTAVVVFVFLSRREIAPAPVALAAEAQS